MPARGREHRVARAVGLRRPGEQPTFTTTGQQREHGEAWGSPLTPGGAHSGRSAPTAAYVEPWTNAWYTSKCDPTPADAGRQRHPRGRDEPVRRPQPDARLLVLPRLHRDELQRPAEQLRQHGSGAVSGGREFDPEIGNVQAGAVSGGSRATSGRDNANQITLNDGIPPITNQYLFQPIAGAFYAPCVDGDMDTSVFGHEYTHLISNRMVAGPDSGLSGLQAGAMGESWSDLDAVEYLHENGYVPTTARTRSRSARTRPATRRRASATTRSTTNPLNYSDIGFDTPGAEVHADGEIWNGVNYDVRQALVDKYNATFPASDAALQKRCAAGKYPPTRARATGAGSSSSTTPGC